MIATLVAASRPSRTGRTTDGYRGIWYSNQSTGDEYRYKYSGGFATYPQQHVPIAIYSAAANKTFFLLRRVDRQAEGTGLHGVVF